MELSFVWSDVLTDLERAADHCCKHHGVRGGPVRREPESPCRPAGGPAAGPGLRQPGPGL
ncbi:MAG: hypothetical protein ACLR5H_06080 [Oscillospiraceae bacterium]